MSWNFSGDNHNLFYNGELVGLEIDITGIATGEKRAAGKLSPDKQAKS